VVLPAAKRATCARLDPGVAATRLVESPEPVSPYFRDVLGGLGRPGFWRERLGRPEAGAYLGRLLWPELLVLPVAPAWALLPLPAALVNIASGGRYLVEGSWHYDHASFALLLVGLVHALGRARRPRPAAAALVAGLGLAVGLAQPPSRTPPWAVLERAFWRFEKDERVRLAEALAAALPAEALTSADYTTLNYLLDGRPAVYMFPNPLESEVFGIAGLCSRWADPPRPELVVLRDDYRPSPALEARLDAGWERWRVTTVEGSARFHVWIDPRSERFAALRAAVHNLDFSLARSRRVQPAGATPGETSGRGGRMRR
jgi:hypothetical protein